MPEKTKSSQARTRIVLGMPDIQDQLLLIDRLVAKASDSERKPLENLGEFLSDLYSQFQHRKSLTIYRFGSKSRTKAD